MGIYDGWSLERLQSEMSRLQNLSDRAGDKASRLEKAYRELKGPKQTARDIKKDLHRVVERDRQWKGDTREQYDKMMTALEEKMKTAIRDLDEYHDAIETARLAASRESKKYIPLISDIASLVKKIGN